MIAAQEKINQSGHKIARMDDYNDDSMGKRVKWAREKLTGLNQTQFGRLLTNPSNPSGVRNIYVSQIERNHRVPALPLLLKIAEVTGVKVGFLLMETDLPFGEPEAVYFSPEADEAARYIDNARPEERARMLAVIKALAENVGNAPGVDNGPKRQAGELTISPFTRLVLRNRGANAESFSQARR
jgi:transcriptional regulator with XRE-family HTH domain